MPKIWQTSSRKLTKEGPILNHESYFFKTARKENKNADNFLSLKIIVLQVAAKAIKNYCSMLFQP